MQDFSDELNRAKERRRTEVVNGTEYTMECTDPYGMWHIDNCDVEELKGTYTSLEVVVKMIKAYEAGLALHNKAKERTILSTDGKGNKTRKPISDFVR